jgi:hypothetical protein
MAATGNGMWVYLGSTFAMSKGHARLIPVLDDNAA